MPRWSNFCYVKFHKPYRVICQFSPSPPKLTLKDFIPLPEIYPAGRLDYRSEGLLVLTNDAFIQHKLTNPKFEHPKTYLVQVEGQVTESTIQFIQNMRTLSGEPLKPVSAEIIPDPQLFPRNPPVRLYHPTSWLRIRLSEGKKHQIRHMTAAAGFPTLRLVRISIGSLTLNNLEPGQWKYLQETELSRLHQELRAPLNQ